MFKLKSNLLLFTFLAFAFGQRTNAISPEMGNNAALLKLISENSSQANHLNDPWEFMAQKFIQDTKYSKKQMALVLIPFVLSMAGFGTLVYKARAGKYPTCDDIKVFETDQSWKLDKSLISLAYPAIPVAVVSAVMFLISKTNACKGESFTKKEKGLGALGLYLFSLAAMNGKPDFLSAKSRIQLISEATTEERESFWKGNWAKAPEIANGVKAYGLLPFIPSTLIAFIIHNLITKYNVEYALKEFLNNYNPDMEKLGAAYSTQCLDKAANPKNKIEIPNYKLLTPKVLHPLFDGIYEEYMNKGDVILAKAAKKVANELKTRDVNVD
jgi:hypothetical protein